MSVYSISIYKDTYRPISLYIDIYISISLSLLKDIYLCMSISCTYLSIEKDKIYKYLKTEIYYKELAHIIKTEKS